MVAFSCHWIWWLWALCYERASIKIYMQMRGSSICHVMKTIYREMGCTVHVNYLKLEDNWPWSGCNEQRVPLSVISVQIEGWVCVCLYIWFCLQRKTGFWWFVYIKLWEFHRIYKIQAQRKMETDTQMQAFIRFNRTHWNGWVFDLSSSRIYFKRNKQKWKFYREKFTAAFCHKDFCCIYGNFDKKKKTHTHTPISITKRKE